MCAQTGRIIACITAVFTGGLGGCHLGDADASLSRETREGPDAVGEDGAVVPEGVACDAGALTGSVFVESAEDLKELARYTSVTGSIYVSGADMEELEGPSCLESVAGHLVFLDNDVLRSVSGFDNLRSVGETLAFAENRVLGSVSGFDALRTAGSMSFEFNAPLLVVEGFAKMRSIESNLSFGGGRHEIYGFGELELIAGRLGGGEIDSVEIYGMNDLSTVGGISFVEVGRIVFDGLVDLERVLGDMSFVETGTIATAGLGDLSVIEGRLRFSNTSMDENTIAGFRDLDYVGGSLTITGGGPAVMDGFPVLEYVGGSLRISESGVRHIAGFDELEMIGGDFFVADLPLERLEGFDELEEVGGHFMVELTDALTALEGFDDLEIIGGDLLLVENPLLAVVSGLDDLRIVGGRLSVIGNEQLHTLELRDLEMLGGASLVVEMNPLLSTCSVHDLVDRLQAGGFAGSVEVAENGPCP